MHSGTRLYVGLLTGQKQHWGDQLSNQAQHLCCSAGTTGKGIAAKVLESTTGYFYDGFRMIA